MNNCALICEYNPFHTGHKYQLDTIRSHGVDNIVCIMSGNFVQSALPAFCDKATRAECAVSGGCDAVVELPALYATASAGYFARGGVMIAASVKNIARLAMGATADADDILRIADIKIKHRNDLQNRIEVFLDSGKSYNFAVGAAIAELCNKLYPDKSLDTVIDEPNNMLCVEYIAAIHDIAPNIEPLIVKRLGAEHGSKALDELYVSATAIREKFDEQNSEVEKFVPFLSKKIADWRLEHTPDVSAYEKILLYAIKTKTPKEIAELRNCADGMEYMFAERNFGTLEEYFDCKQFRRFGKKRLRRLFLDAAIDAKKQCFENEFCTRLLACRRNFDISILPRNVAANNSRLKELNGNTSIKQVSDIDERATALYNTVCGVQGGYYNYSLVKL